MKLTKFIVASNILYKKGGEKKTGAGGALQKLKGHKKKKGERPIEVEYQQIYSGP